VNRAFVIFAALTLWPTLGLADVSTAGIDSEIARVGAAKAVEDLYDSPKDWKDLMDSIATGEPQWLRIAVRLRPGVDGGSAEELLQAIGEGLEHRPKDVLALAVPTYRLENICGTPDFDDSRFDSMQSALAAISRRRALVARIVEPNLRKRANDCIRLLDESKQDLMRFFEAPPATVPNK
jgi:hypothetical protein